MFLEKIKKKKWIERTWSTGLAGLRTIAVRLGGGGGGGGNNSNRKRKASRKKIKKVKEKLMDLWHKMLFPARRVWLAVSARVKDRKNGLSILSIYLLLLYLFFFFIFFFFWYR